MEQALVDLVAKQQRQPSSELARMIELLREEIEIRKRSGPEITCCAMGYVLLHALG